VVANHILRRNKALRGKHGDWLRVQFKVLVELLGPDHEVLLVDHLVFVGSAHLRRAHALRQDFDFGVRLYVLLDELELGVAV